jgi:deoxycytidylate deaminase
MEHINLSKSWKRGFDAASAASMHSNGPTVGMRLGAALYAGSNLLSVGFNIWDKTTPHSSFSKYNGNVHAEVMALIKRWHYDKSNNLILYVCRTTTNSIQTIFKYGCSRPCSSCLMIAREYGIKRIRFIDENGKPKEVKF